VATWREYEEQAAQFFRDLGMQAETNKEIEGARGKHHVDVLVTLERIGITQTWIIECKCWRRRVDKLHVLGLASIVSDTGADRGFLLTEVGFQSGAIRAARTSNITLTGLEDLRATAAEELAEVGLGDARRRIALLRARLTRVDELDRATTPGSGFWVRSHENFSVLGRLGFAETALSEVHLDRWPLLYDFSQDGGIRASNLTELADGLRALLDALEVEVSELETTIGQRPCPE
jgi:Restriction endonuclease